MLYGPKVLLHLFLKVASAWPMRVSVMLSTSCCGPVGPRRYGCFLGCPFCGCPYDESLIILDLFCAKTYDVPSYRAAIVTSAALSSHWRARGRCGSAW